MLHGRLRDEGFEVGRDRVYRLCRKYGFKVLLRRRKQRAIGFAKNAVHVRAARSRHDVWTWDFVSDQTMSDRRTFRVLTVVDEYTREPLLVFVWRRINSVEVIRQLQILFARHGVPRHIRSDNGPEFIAKRLRAHLKEHRVETLYVEPGCPWQNGIVESFNGRLRDECMDVEAFYSLAEAKVIIEDYRRYYRDQRPHSSLGYRTPKAFIAGLAAATSDEAPNAMNTENRVDGEEDAAPLPLQTTPSTPLQARPEACVGTT
jgi:transposase InsO family protein